MFTVPLVSKKCLGEMVGPARDEIIPRPGPALRAGQEREEMLLEEISSSRYLQTIKIRRGECGLECKAS